MTIMPVGQAYSNIYVYVTDPADPAQTGAMVTVTDSQNMPVGSGGAQINGAPFTRRVKRLPAGVYTATAAGNGKSGSGTATV
jgi:hypothetical protein